MKKLFLLLLALLCITLILVSCGDEEKPAESTGEQSTSEPTEHEHAFTVIDRIVDPTCTENGYTVYKCSLCEETENRDSTQPLDHNYVDVVTKQATCKETGTKELKCTRCENVKSTETIAKSKQHTAGTPTVQEATCEAGGFIRITCSVCNALISDEQTNPLGHTVDDWNVTTVSKSCSTDGYTRYACKREGCDYYYDEDVVLAGHTENAEKDATLSEAPDCVTDGKDVYTCSVCHVVTREVPVGKLGHNYQTTNTVLPTCENAGYTVQTCSRCQDQKQVDAVDPLNHDWNDGEVIAPTCVDDGYTLQTCQRTGCGQTQQINSVSATGVHSYTVKQQTVPASCTEDAYDLMKCATCTATEKQYLSGAGNEALGHHYTFEETYLVKETNSTCEKQGYKQYKCDRCEETIDEDASKDMKPIVDHTKGDNKGTTAPTCVSQGYTSYICSVCDTEFKADYVSATGVHTYDTTDATTIQEVVAPTCSTEGYTVYQCTGDSTCTATKNDTFTARTAHTLVETNKGIIKCTACLSTYENVALVIETVDKGTGTVEGGEGENAFTLSVVVTGTKDSGTQYFVQNTDGVEIEPTDDIYEGIVTIAKENGITYTVLVYQDDEYVTVDTKYATATDTTITYNLYAYGTYAKVKVTASDTCNSEIVVYSKK